MNASPLSSMNFDFDLSSMSFSTLFKKATNLLGIGSPSKPPPLDGEIIYCKNNVCVHPPAVLRSETQHHPGYLNIRSQDDEVLGQTLILTWIPNTTLKKNPRSIENSPARSGAPLKISPRRSPRQEFAKVDYSSPSPSQSPEESVASDKESKDKSNSGYHSGNNSNSSSESSTPLLEKAKLLQRSLQNNLIHGSPMHKRDVGKNVNDIHGKISNAERGARSEDGYEGEEEAEIGALSNSSSSSSDLDSPREEKKLFNMMLAKNKLQEKVKERTSSSRSVTSIEMEGDNLVVVTEEVDDSIFLDDNQTPCSSGEIENSDETILQSDSRDNNSEQSQRQPVSQDKDLLCDTHSDTGASSATTPSHSPNAHVSKLKSSLDLKLQLDTDGLPIDSTSDVLTTPEISITRSRTSSGSSSLTSGPDSNPPTPPSSCPDSPKFLSESEVSEVGSEGVHNCRFPDNSVTFSESPSNSSRKMTARDQVCGVFSVDLGQMRSLRVFCSNDSCTSGQLVIASRESQYKILHFHNHGLDRLAEIFSEWKFLAQPKDKKKMVVAGNCKHFSVIRPYLSEGQGHPEEGAYEVVNYETYKQHMNEEGQIEDDFELRKAVFFAGLEPSVRPEMWPFLLHYYPYKSTFEERERLRNDKYIEYQNIRKARESMTEDEKEIFWRNTQCIVEKDVVRTDRSHPYFKGEDNPNIEILKNILLNYAVAHPHYGYTQGMSDLLAPLLVEIQHEADAYWCFEGLMQKTIFVSSPKDIDMDKQLTYLLELLRIMQPRFYHHLEKVQDGMELLFVHRWILLCFKREFPESDALRMWEACWAHYQTDYFHLFLCVAIIAVYGEDVVQQDLPADEMLLHFSSLSMHMSGEVVLRKARGLLHQFRLREKIPCTLDELCTLCGPGIWDSGHVPTVECVGNHPDDSCPFGGTVDANAKTKKKK